MSGRTKGILAIIASAFGFAIMATGVRLCDDYGAAIPCFEKSFFRNLIALLIAAVAFLRSKSAFKADGKDWSLMILRSVLGTIGIFANFYALSYIPIAEGQTLNKTAPFFTLIFAWMFLRERVSFRQMLAVVIAFLGTILVAKPGFAGAHSFPLAMGLLGGICAGGAYTAVHALGSKGVRSALIVLVFSAFSCLASIPFMWASFVPLTFPQFLVLILTGVGAAIGQFGITSAYRFAAPREIAVYDYSNIIFTALFGFVLFGQVSDALAILGMATIVLAAVVLNLWYNTKR